MHIEANIRSTIIKHAPATNAIKGLFIPCPFNIEIDPMQRLLLINFEKDPDKIYIGFEPQVFDDPVNGKGMLVLGWRIDGRVDVYHDPGLMIRPAKYDIAGKGLAHQISRGMKSSFFFISEKGVQAHILFDDLEGRNVELRIEERSIKRRQPFSLLAPMGDAAENPSSLPLVLLHDFYFIRKHKTVIYIKINGKTHKPDKLPFPIDGQFMYFTRYCPDPTIATLNPAQDGQVPLVEIFEDENSAEKLRVKIDQSGSKAAILSIARKYKNREVRIHFEPAFPDLSGLKENSTTRGNFRIDEDPSIGTIKGHYTLQKKEEDIQVTMIPSGGWVPREKKLSLKLLYSIAGIFRNWPTTYKWTADIRIKDDGEMYMKSGWERIGS